MEHCTTIHQLGEGAVQAVCSCGWHSPVFGAGKRTGTMDPLQHATEAADLHEWEMSLRLASIPGAVIELSPASARGDVDGVTWADALQLPAGPPSTSTGPAS